MVIYSGFSHIKWWFSTAMLNYQRVISACSKSWRFQWSLTDSSLDYWDTNGWLASNLPQWRHVTPIFTDPPSDFKRTQSNPFEPLTLLHNFDNDREFEHYLCWWDTCIRATGEQTHRCADLSPLPDPWLSWHKFSPGTLLFSCTSVQTMKWCPANA